MRKNILFFYILVSSFLYGSGFDDIFKIKKKIVLEQNNEIFIGSVRNCYVEKNKIIIVDSKNSNVKIYNLEGKLIKVVGQKGRGPGEFQKPVGIDVDSKFMYISDIRSRKLNVFDLKNFKFVKSFTIIDGRELKIRNNKIYLSYVDLENNKCLHEYSLAGEKINSYIPVPKITVENQLIADLTTFDFDSKGNVYFINEMSYEVFRGLNGNFKSFIKGGGKGKYIPPPSKPFQNFYSKKLTLDWLNSWTHILKLSVSDKYNKLLIYMMNDEDENIVDIYNLDGKLINECVATNMRLLCTDTNGYVYFLEEKTNGLTINFVIKKYIFK